MNLKISNDLSLPLDVVTQTMAVLAKRRAGKSYCMRRLAEQLFKAGQQIVIVDPKGDQWGIRSASNGRDPGLPIVILGGERGDVALEASSGEVIAKLVVEERISVLLDLSLFRKHEVATFMTAFMENLYRLKAREIYRTPMMLVIDEADAIAPQKPQKGEERMLGAAEDIVRRGGQRGIGCVLVSQRSAVLNKNVLTQAQILVVLRTIAPQDLAAMKAWIDVHGDEDQGKRLMASLPSLPVGDAWFWSPGWPTTDGIFKRVHVLPIETFDSGASPKPGAKMVEPKNLADIDLNALKGHMAATIEKSKADNPKLLRARISELERDLTKQRNSSGSLDTESVNLAEERGYERGVKFAADALSPIMPQLRRTSGDIATVVRELEGLGAALESDSVKPVQIISDFVKQADQFANNHKFRHVADSTIKTGNGSGDKSIGNSGKRRILIALAQNTAGLTYTKLSLLTGISQSGGTWRTYLGELRGLEYVEGGNGHVKITDAGLKALGSYDPLPTGGALIDYWRNRLGNSGKRAIFNVVIEAYPKSLTQDAVSRCTGIAIGGGTWRTYLGELRGLELINGRGELRASDELFN